MLKLKFTLLLCLTLLLASLAGGPSRADEPLKLGAAVPDFTLRSLDGEEVTLSEIERDKAVVIVVLRGYPGYQCPLCSRQVASLVRVAPQITGQARVLLIYPGPGDLLGDKAAEFFADTQLPEGFQALLDADYSFTDAYGLRWDAPRETAYPSTLVLDQQHKLRFVYVSKSHGDRVPADKLLEALGKLK